MTTTSVYGEHDVAADLLCPGSHPALQRPPGNPVWCLDCEQRIAEALQPPAGYLAKLGIADLAARVASRRDGRTLATARAAARATRSSGQASVSPGWDEVDKVTRTTAQMATELATAMGHPPAPDDDLTAGLLPQLHWALGYLHHHLRRALTLPGAEKFGSDVLGMHRHLQRMAGEQNLRRRLRVPCPACDALGVIREEGSDRVECVGCGLHWSEETFQTALSRTAS